MANGLSPAQKHVATADLQYPHQQQPEAAQSLPKPKKESTEEERRRHELSYIPAEDWCMVLHIGMSKASVCCMILEAVCELNLDMESIKEIAGILKALL